MESSRHDWEILHLTTTKQMHRRDSLPLPRHELHTQSRTRLRVRVTDRLGQSISWTSSPPDRHQLRQAVTAAARGPACTRTFGAQYPPSHGTPTRVYDVQELTALPEVMQVVVRQRCARFATAAGASLEWVTADAHVVVGHPHCGPVAIIDVTEGLPTDLPTMPSVNPVPVTAPSDTVNHPVLIGPLALAAIYSEQLQTCLHHHATRPPFLHAFPQVYDDGGGPPTDLEGTERRSTILHDPDGRWSPARTLTTGTPEETLSGHGGLTGAHFENLTVGAGPVRFVPQHLDCHVVLRARLLPGMPNLYALSVLSSRQRVDTVVAELRPLALLQDCDWVGPIQYGENAWKSGWLEISEPCRSIRVLHTEVSS